MGPKELAEAINFNLQAYGKPRFVDFTVPEEPLYSFQPPASLEKVFNSASVQPQLSITARTTDRLSAEGKLKLSAPQVATFNLAEENFADKESFIKALSQQPVMQARFAQYLMGTPTTKKLKGGQFVAGQGLTIFDLFDLLELQFYYREFIDLV